MRAGRSARPAYGPYVTAPPYKALRVCGAVGGGAGDRETRGRRSAATRPDSCGRSGRVNGPWFPAPTGGNERWAGMSGGPGRRRPPVVLTKSLGGRVDLLVTFLPLGP